MAQIVSKAFVYTLTAPVYGVAGGHVDPLVTHQKIDAPEIDSVIVVLVGIKYVPLVSVIDGVAVVGPLPFV